MSVCFCFQLQERNDLIKISSVKKIRSVLVELD